MHRKDSKRKTLIILISLIISIVLVAIILIKTIDNNTVIENNTVIDNNKAIENNTVIDNNAVNNSSTDANPLIGAYTYKTDGTVYEFNNDGTGKMIWGDYKYDYKYIAQNGNLEIDFIEEKVHDAKYTYSIDNNILTLISIEGTVVKGKEYKLEKENK